MKYIAFALLITCSFLACDDDQNKPTPTPTEISIRLDNQTTETVEHTFLRFTEQGAAAAFTEFGALGPDEVTAYQVFDQAGSCGIDYFSQYNGSRGGPRFQSSCECICPLEPGNYTATLSYRVSGNIAFFDVRITEDE